jgi:hypothetical protein
MASCEFWLDSIAYFLPAGRRLGPAALLPAFYLAFRFPSKTLHGVADEPKASGKELERFSTPVLSIYLISTVRHYSSTDCSLTGRWRTPYSAEGVGARFRTAQESAQVGTGNEHLHRSLRCRARRGISLFPRRVVGPLSARLSGLCRE